MDITKRKLLNYLKGNVTYFRLHLAYFILIAFIGTLILWGIGYKPSQMDGFSIIDCLYSITSALCITGLSSVPTEGIPVGGQVVLMLMMILGGQVVTSVVPLFVKKHRYCKIAKKVLGRDLEGNLNQRSRELYESPSRSSISQRISRSEPLDDQQENASNDASQQLDSGAHRVSQRRLRSDVSDNKSFRVFKRISGSLRFSDEIWIWEMASKKHAEHLTEFIQEARATIVLTRIVLAYYVFVHVIGFFFTYGCVLGHKRTKRSLDEKRVNAGFFALFSTVSAFANAGFVLVNENMTLFSSSKVLLLNLVVLILLGNTMFAPAVRGIIIFLHRYGDERLKEVYEFLLEHPRRCYTHLFPRKTTIWLVVVVTAFNGFECIMFYALDWRSKALKAFSTGQRLVNGIFQSVNTRSAGMNSINLIELSPSMLFLYCGMMYIAAYPVFLSRQSSRHHHRQNQQEVPTSQLMGLNRDIHDTTITTQSRRLLAQDWAYLFLSTFFICVSENKHLKSDPINYSIFSVIFEVMSAYGNVGLTLGYSCSSRLDSAPCKDVPYSFSGKWGVIGKLFIIVVMFMGRHRGLPDGIDSAILLPEERFYVMVKNQFPDLPGEDTVQHGSLPPRSDCTENLT